MTSTESLIHDNPQLNLVTATGYNQQVYNFGTQFLTTALTTLRFSAEMWSQ